MRHTREANRAADLRLASAGLKKERKQAKGRAEAFIEMREDCENYPV